MIAVAATTGVRVVSFGSGFYAYILIIKHGWPTLVGVAAVAAGLAGCFLIPAYVVKKLLVDYW